MKDMSVEELLEIVSRKLMFDFEYYDKAKAELLRRFEAMKCCGNCVAFDGTTICFLKDDIMYCNKYCSQWQYDGLTREEREGK
jgi:hypothetical protein